jgi:hypothetical protein
VSVSPRSESIRQYDVHGVRLEVTTPDARVGTAVASRLRQFARNSIQVDIHWRIASDGRLPSRPRGAGRPVYDPPRGEVLYFDATDELFIDYEGRVRVLVAAAEGVVETGFRGDDDEARALASHPLFTIPLLELCKRRSRHPLHAACVARDGRGLVLPGGSGSGKSTLAIALLRAGCAFLSDDMVFLAEGGTRVLAFPDELDVTDETARMIPELAGLVGRATTPGRPKHSVRVEEAFATQIDSECRAVALVMPRITKRAASRLEPLGADEALLELAPNVLLTEPESSQSHFDALAALAGSVPCYRLETGRDLAAAVDCLRPLLD